VEGHIRKQRQAAKKQKIRDGRKKRSRKQDANLIFFYMVYTVIN
jgi:hypothetical protein